MAPVRQADSVNAELIGRRVLVPKSVWPDEPPPAGQRGWEGTVEHARGPKFEAFYVSFPTDPSTYWFSAKDIRKWLLPKSMKESQRPAPPTTSHKKKTGTSTGTAALSKEQAVNSSAQAAGPEEPGTRPVVVPANPGPGNVHPVTLTPVSTGRPSLDCLINVAYSLTDEDMLRLTHKAKKLRTRSVSKSSSLGRTDASH